MPGSSRQRRIAFHGTRTPPNSGRRVTRINGSQRSSVLSKAKYAAAAVRTGAALYNEGKKLYVDLSGGKSNPASKSGAKSAMNMSATSRASGRSSTKFNGNATSGGKFSKGSKGFKTQKPAEYMRKGVLKTQEYTGTVSAADCCYLGHSTKMQQQELYMLSYAIIKHLYTSAGHAVTNFDEATPYQLPERISLYYYGNATTTTVSSTNIVVAAGDTFSVVGNALRDFFVGQFNSGVSALSMLRIVLAQNYDTAGVPTWSDVHSLDLTSCKLHFYSKSTLKLQNRSTNQTDKDADNVDNIPLNGKSYNGKGNGAIIKGNRIAPYKPFIANEFSGVIEGIEDVGSLLEPPDGTQFQGVKKVGKVHLNPGEIKTSNLEGEWTISLNLWLSLAQRVGAGFELQLYRLHNKGEYWFSAFEKMINVDALVPIVIAWEVDSKLGCFINIKKHTTTAQLVQV